MTPHSREDLLRMGIDLNADKRAAQSNEPQKWTRVLARRVRQRTGNCITLHGPGIRDLHPLGEKRYGTITQFLSETVFRARSVIVLYDRGSGIRFADSHAEQDFRTVLKAYDSVGGTNFSKTQPRDPDVALQLIEIYLRDQLTAKTRFSAAVIVDYAETIAPAGQTGQLPVSDRNAIVTLRRWASDPQFLQRSVTFCLICESAASLHAPLVEDARTFELTVPVPDMQERLRYVTGRGGTPDTFSRIKPDQVARLTAGLTRLHLESLLADVDHSGGPVKPEALGREKRRLIEEASGGLLSFLHSADNLDAVAGHEGAKKLLRETARSLRAGRADVMPMGFLICGPVGTGKSFIVRCFAAEIGIPVVELLNFRSMWQGQTEANLERILDLLDSIGPIAVMVDEADASLGKREMAGADSGVSERVFARLAAFMGDSRRRGKVVWFLITSRPDLVPVDLKRQGRAEEHIALFSPSTPTERAHVFHKIAARLGVPVADRVDAEKLFAPVSSAISPADIEAILARAGRRMVVNGKEEVSPEVLQELIADFKPPSYPLEIEYQRLVAASECTSRGLLPDDLAQLAPGEMSNRIVELRAALGR